MTYHYINPKSPHEKNHLKPFLNQEELATCCHQLRWQLGVGVWDVPLLGYCIEPQSLRSALGYSKKEVVTLCCETTVLKGWNERFKIYVTDPEGPYDRIEHVPGASIQDYTGYLEVEPWRYGEKGPSMWDVVKILKKHYSHKVQKGGHCGCYEPVYLAGFKPVRDGIGCVFMHQKFFDAPDSDTE